MKICLLGLDNLSVLLPEYGAPIVGGEPVQQTLLARALARRGHEVSMVVGDHGQADGMRVQGIRLLKAYRPAAGIPVLRFIHPRWTGIWSALKRADADVYYTSCAGMHVGLLAHFCRRYRKRFVFRAASNADCDRSGLLVQYARDRWLYEHGLKQAHAVLVQSAWQARTMQRHYGVGSRVAGMLVDEPMLPARRDIDVLWMSNIRSVKRPDRLLRIADELPEYGFHMVGGPLGGEEALYREIAREAAARKNVHFHGPLSYLEANAIYGRAKLLLNTSDVEGFPNSYLQAWIRGVPVVTLIDPDGVIKREALGCSLAFATQLPAAIRHFLQSPAAWKLASDRCVSFMQREYAEASVTAPYLETFEALLRGSGEPDAGVAVPADAHHA